METTASALHRQILNWCPPVVANWARAIKRSLIKRPGSEPILFEGDFARWEDASKASVGYDSEVILGKVLDATLMVKNGQAAFERDSVAFDKMEYSWPILTNLLFAAAKNRGALSVVDFGGALGSTYFQSRPFLDRLTSVRWSVVEQPHFVETGRSEIADDRLRFFDSVADAVNDTTPDVLLLSGVLQCIPNPYATLEDLLSHSWSHVIIDRTPFLLSRDTDRLTVQTVPAWIYSASYPSWFFAKDKFAPLFAENFDISSSWTCDEYHSPPGEQTSYEGYCYTRKAAPRAN
jgi:putative methyltransferase (TIGR04325 family)